MMSGTEEDVIEYIEQARIKFKKMPVEEIAFPRSVSDVNKHKNATKPFMVRVVPMHVQGRTSP